MLSFLEVDDQNLIVSSFRLCSICVAKTAPIFFLM